MSSDSPQEAETSELQSTTSRKQSLFFLTKFLLFAAILLIGYRYSINSSANIRYLYTIATQTSFTLDILGHNSELEPDRIRYTRATVRAEFDELGIGRRMSSREDDNTEPPSTWEYWLLSAHRNIQNDLGLTDHGPTIRFTARQGLASQRKEAVQRLASDPERTDTSVSDVLDLQTKIKSLDDEIAKLATTPDASKKINDRAFDFRIVPDCGAIPSMAIYISAVLAFPVALRKRLIGAAAGVAVLYVINIGRLVILAFIGAYDTTPSHKWFTFIHEYVWQSIFLLFVVCVWLAWVELMVKPRQTNES